MIGPSISFLKFSPYVLPTLREWTVLWRFLSNWRSMVHNIPKFWYTMDQIKLPSKTILIWIHEKRIYKIFCNKVEWGFSHFLNNLFLILSLILEVIHLLQQKKKNVIHKYQCLYYRLILLTPYKGSCHSIYNAGSLFHYHASSNSTFLNQEIHSFLFIDLLITVFGNTILGTYLLSYAVLYTTLSTEI